MEANIHDHAPILGQKNPVHALPIDVLKIQFKIILLSTPMSSKWLFRPPVSLPKSCMHHPLLPHVTSPAHFIFHDLITWIIFGEEDKSRSYSMNIANYGIIIRGG
jgi:hypothetical protein